MNPAPGTSAPAGNGGGFDPRQAATLLDQTTQDARRKLAPSPPWLLATRGVAVLAALGAIWLSVRGQHPYQGPTGADIPILVAFVVLNFAATVAVRQHAMTGVRGRTRFRPAEITILVLSWAVVPAVHVGTGGRRGQLRLVPHHRADHPRPGLGRRPGRTRRLARRPPWASRSPPPASRARSPGPPDPGPSPAWACAPSCWPRPRPSPASSAHDGAP